MQIRYWLSTAILTVFVLITASLPIQAQSEEVTEHYVESTPENVIWGELYIAEDEPILTVKSGDIVTVENHLPRGNIWTDQGDTVEFFTNAGIDEADILARSASSQRTNRKNWRRTPT